MRPRMLVLLRLLMVLVSAFMCIQKVPDHNENAGIPGTWRLRPAQKSLPVALSAFAPACHPHKKGYRKGVLS